MPGRPLCLFVFANAAPDSAGHLRHLAAERNGLRDAHRRMDDGLGVEVMVEVDPSPAALLDLLDDDDVKRRLVLLHYSGHAAPDRWLLPDAAGAGALFADGFVRRIAALPALRLVVLNGCSTAAQARSLADGRRAVIGTDGPIADDVAEIFAVRLYHALSRGASVGEAFGGARDDVLALRSGVAERLWRMARPRGAKPKGLPWHLAPAADGDAAPDAWSWRLSDAVRDPLAGLPPLPREPLPESPYRHVERFTGAYAEVFFGRGRTIRRIFDALVDPDGAPALVICGVAGVGKSSLLEAGVVPRLRALDRRVATHRHDPATALADGLRGCLGIARGAPLDWAAAESAAGGPIVAVIDQVEEALIAAEGRHAVLDALLAPVGRAFADPDGPRGRLVLSLRKSHLAEVREALRRNGLRFAIVFVEPLDRDAVVEIVRGPVSTARLRDHYRLTLEDGLAARIADDLTAGAPAAVAPILQIVLTGMWGDPAGRAVRFDGARYEAVRRGGVTLERVFSRQLAQAEARAGDDGRVLDVLAFHTTGRGTSRARRAAEVAERYAGGAAVVASCIDARLLGRWSAEGDAAERGTRLAHDVWGPLVLDAERASERPGQRARRILEHRAGDWGGGDEGQGLLDRYDLARVEAGVGGMRALTHAESALIEASRAAVARADSRRRRRRIMALAAVALIALTAAVAGWLSWQLDGALEAETAARQAATAALEAETAANEKTSEALEDVRALGWLKMAGEHAGDPTLVAAALAEVPPERRGPEWLRAALVALDQPVAADWIAADRMLGFAPDGRLAVVREGQLELHDLESGRVFRKALPPDWSRAPLTFDGTGALVGLLRLPGTGRRGRVEARRLEMTGAAPTTLGEAFDCSLSAVRPGRGRWLFGGRCRNQGGRPWLMGQAGARIVLSARALAHVADRLDRVKSVDILAVDPHRPRMALCSTIELRGQGEAQTSKVAELVAQVGDAVVRGPLGVSGGRCPMVAFSAEGHGVMIGGGGLVGAHLSPSATDWALDALAARGESWPMGLAQRHGGPDPLRHWLQFVGPDHLALAAENGRFTLVPARPAPLDLPRTLGSGLGLVAAPWKAWALEEPAGMEHDDRIAVHPAGRWLVNHHLGTARVWPGSARAASASLAAGVIGAPSAAESLVQDRLPPRHHVDPAVDFVAVAHRPFQMEAFNLAALNGVPTSADGVREVVWADGKAYLNTRPSGEPDGQTRPAWSVELPERARPLRMSESYRFVGGGRWLIWTHALGGAAAVWPATIGAAGDLLAQGRRGCMPPHFYSTYQAISLEDARAIWARCEQQRRPVVTR